MLELIALGSGEGSRGFPRLLLIHRPADRGAASNVVPVEKFAWSAVRGPNFKAAAVGNALGGVGNDANAIGHGA